MYATIYRSVKRSSGKRKKLILPTKNFPAHLRSSEYFDDIYGKRWVGFDGWTNIEEVHLLATHLSYDDDDGDDDSGGDGVVMKTLIDFFLIFWFTYFQFNVFYQPF